MAIVHFLCKSIVNIHLPIRVDEYSDTEPSECDTDSRLADLFLTTQAFARGTLLL